MSLWGQTPMERSQQSRDDFWKQYEKREQRARFAEIDFTTLGKPETVKQETQPDKPDENTP